MSILGDSIRYHWKMLRTTSRELIRPRMGIPALLKCGTVQNGWTKETSLVKYRSRVRRCSSGFPWQRDLTTDRISCSDGSN